MKGVVSERDLFPKNAIKRLQHSLSMILNVYKFKIFYCYMSIRKQSH